MIALKSVRKEVAERFPETPLIIHDIDVLRHDIRIKDDALASVEFKKNLLLITFDLDYCVRYNFDWCIALRREDFTFLELY